MRHSIGSAWIFSICLTFIIIFTAYLTITMNYAKAFRVKNNIVSFIEEHEGYNEGYDYELEEYLHYEGYTASGRCENRIYVEGYENDWDLQTCLNQDTNGQCDVCIYKENTNSCGQRGTYRVVTFFKFDIPVVRYFSSFQVSGETRYFYDFASCE